MSRDRDDPRPDEEVEVTDPELLPEREVMSTLTLWPDPDPSAGISDVTPPPPDGDN